MNLPKLLCVLSGTLALTACQAAGTPEPAAAGTTLYRYTGTKQCEGGGLTPEGARKELAASGVTAVEATCGTDGRIYAASCGMPDGRIVVVEVRRDQVDAARSKGFEPLAALPQARRSRCN